jgi:hypothetical protein
MLEREGMGSFVRIHGVRDHYLGRNCEFVQRENNLFGPSFPDERTTFSPSVVLCVKEKKDCSLILCSAQETSHVRG